MVRTKQTASRKKKAAKECGAATEDHKKKAAAMKFKAATTTKDRKTLAPIKENNGRPIMDAEEAKKKLAEPVPRKATTMIGAVVDDTVGDKKAAAKDVCSEAFAGGGKKKSRWGPKVNKEA